MRSMPAMRPSAHVAHGAHQLGFAGHFVLDAGHALELPDAAANAVDGDLQHQLVARHLEVQGRSEEHTSELQSHSDLVCRLLREKKNRSLTIAVTDDAYDSH